MTRIKKKNCLVALALLVLLMVIFGLTISIISTKIVNTRYYVYCQLIRPGMTKQAVDAALEPLEPYYENVEDPFYYYLHVRANNDLLTQLAVGHMVLLYDNDGKLVGAGREVSLGDWGEGANCKNKEPSD